LFREQYAVVSHQFDTTAHPNWLLATEHYLLLYRRRNAARSIA
jgi:hypothetical protein